MPSDLQMNVTRLLNVCDFALLPWGKARGSILLSPAVSAIQGLGGAQGGSC